MRDVKRIDKVLTLIRKIWKKRPELRLCQLIGNCFTDNDLYHMEDNKLEKALRHTYKKERVK